MTATLWCLCLLLLLYDLGRRLLLQLSASWRNLTAPWCSIAYRGQVPSRSHRWTYGRQLALPEPFPGLELSLSISCSAVSIADTSLLM